jgi:hypothetical protein
VAQQSWPPGAEILGGTAGAGRGATGGSKPGAISGVVRQGTGLEVPTVVSQVPMVETV